MERAGQRLWWVLVVVGVVFLAHAALDVFDPSDATDNPYNKVELYAEMPGPQTAQSVLGMFLGIFGLLAIIAVEFSFSEDPQFRPLTTPVRLLLFILVGFGLILHMIGSLRELELMPDMAHYYYALRSDGQHHAPALLTEFISLDRNALFALSCIAVWLLVLTVEQRVRGRIHLVLAGLGVLYVLSTILLVFFTLTHQGFPALIMTFVGPGIMAPVWFIAMGIHLRRESRGKIHVS